MSHKNLTFVAAFTFDFEMYVKDDHFLNFFFVAAIALTFSSSYWHLFKSFS